jgi:hypothetical protein
MIIGITGIMRSRCIKSVKFKKGSGSLDVYTRFDCLLAPSDDPRNGSIGLQGSRPTTFWVFDELNAKNHPRKLSSSNILFLE